MVCLLYTSQGVNIPYTKIPFPALAERDNADSRFGLEQGLNFIAISFVRTAKDVQEVRAICEETGNGHVQLLAKIENQQLNVTVTSFFTDSTNFLYVFCSTYE